MTVLCNQEPHMWGYWRDKKGVEEALTVYYPESLRADPMLMAALVQMRSAEALIDRIMQEAGARG